jgi:arylsulfatase A-like enzyme
VRWRVPEVYQPSSGPNVVFVTVDTLRADHLGCYGYPRPTSPAIDRLAARGLLFRHAESVQSATWPAITSLHTSLYPSAHGVVWNGWQPREGITTLAELLRARGFATAAFVTNMLRARHPGFSRVHLARAATQAEQDRRATDAAIAHLDHVRDRRFFLWLHLLSPHADYAPPPPHDDAFARGGTSRLDGTMTELVALRERGERLGEEDVARIVDLYDGEVAFADEQVGRLLDALRERGLERTTLVVFSADHGEDLHQHNAYFFHSPSMYSSSLAVPLVLSWPGVLPQGEATDHPASLVDVAPTVLSLLGLPVPSFFQGHALLEGRRVPREAARRVAFSETSGRVFGARTPEWRLVYNPEKLHPDAPGGPYPIGELELYDLRSDPSEQRDVATERRDVAERLTADVLAWRARHAGANGPAGQQVDAATREELRSLGYIVP